MTDEAISKEMCYILRHNSSGTNMDEHGFVKVKELVHVLNKHFKNDARKVLINDVYRIVEQDDKQRYMLKNDNELIRCAQGHTIKGLDLELKDVDPPAKLYHGTTVKAWKKIQETGRIDKMERHAVHMQGDVKKANKSAVRWHDEIPCILTIDSRRMYEDGYIFQISTNGVYLTDNVPIQYVINTRVVENEKKYFNPSPKNNSAKAKKKNFNNKYVWR